MDVKWIKIVTNIFDDEKMLLIESMPEGDAIIVVWFKLLCLAGKQNNQGVFMLNDKIPYTDEMLATIFRKNVKTVRLALETFKAFGMVEVIEGAITIPNWSKHQSIEQLENKKEYMREYMREYRNSKKALNECKPLRKTNVSSLDKEKEKEIYISSSPSASVRACEGMIFGDEQTVNAFICNTGIKDAYYVDGIDYSALEEKISESEYLKNANFYWIEQNYSKIMKNAYKTHKTTKKNFENERVYTPQEMNSFITNVDEIDI